jgi:hypothetical protein
LLAGGNAFDRSVKDIFFNGDERKKEGDLLPFPMFGGFQQFLKDEE